jgi:hypothetical protein
VFLSEVKRFIRVTGWGSSADTNLSPGVSGLGLFSDQNGVIHLGERMK